MSHAIPRTHDEHLPHEAPTETLGHKSNPPEVSARSPARHGEAVTADDRGRSGAAEQESGGLGARRRRARHGMPRRMGGRVYGVELEAAVSGFAWAAVGKSGGVDAWAGSRGRARAAGLGRKAWAAGVPCALRCARKAEEGEPEAGRGTNLAARAR